MTVSAPGQKKTLYRRITAARNDYVVWMQLNTGQDPLNMFTNRTSESIKPEVGAVGPILTPQEAKFPDNTDFQDNSPDATVGKICSSGSFAMDIPWL